MIPALFYFSACNIKMLRVSLASVGQPELKQKTKKLESRWRDIHVHVMNVCHVTYAFPLQLEVCNAMYLEGQAKGSEADDEDSPLEVGHNIYILAYKLADHKKELRVALDKAEQQGHKAVRHYAKNTAQIEVCM